MGRGNVLTVPDGDDDFATVARVLREVEQQDVCPQGG
ncbi:hypothetical protein EDD98_1447 [Streptomyces sp. PanSC19]|nr:hypothetical protein EDD98_1447 [Streptomyces sp. PanSC19]